MLLRPEQANFDAARKLHAHLSGRLLVAGEVCSDGSRQIERPLPNGAIARLHNYLSIYHAAYAGNDSYDSLLEEGDSVISCEITPPPIIDLRTTRSHIFQNKPVAIYQPHDIRPNTLVGYRLHPISAVVPEGEYVAAFSSPHERMPMIPLLNPEQHDTIRMFAQ